MVVVLGLERAVGGRRLRPEKRATEAFQVGIRIFYDSVCLLVPLRDSLGAPNELQNEFQNRLQNGPEMGPKPVLQDGAKVDPKVTCPQLWHTGARERPSINFNDV